MSRLIYMIKKIKTEVNDNRLAVIILTVIFILKLIFVFSLNNVDWEPDSYMHFLELKTIYSNFPNNLDLGLGVWTKPLYAYLFGIPVTIFSANSFFIVQILNLLIFAVIGYIIFKITQILFKNKMLSYLTIILTSFSLTLFKSSTSSLTEPIFTLFLVLGFYFSLKNRFEISSVLIGLSILGRIEGLFFIGIYFFYILFKIKKPKLLSIHLLLLSLPGLMWNFLGYLQTGYPIYIFDNGYPSTPGAYGYGEFYSIAWQFITREPIIFLISLGAIIIFLKNFKKLTYRYELSLLYSWSFIFIAIQSILWWKGLFGSAGLMRYFVSIIPFMIILLIFLISSLIKRDHKIKLTAYFLSVSQIIILLIFILGIIPGKQEYPVVDSELVEAGQWVKENVNQETFLASDRPEIIYYADRDLNNSTIFYKEILAKREKGIYIWTKDWGEAVSNVRQEELSSEAELIYIINNDVFIYRLN